MKRIYTLLTLVLSVITLSLNAQETYMVTFNVNMANETVAESGVFLAGGGAECFGDPGVYELTDSDLDGVYSLTLELEAGFSCLYTFTNGNCPDYSCKESLIGQDCASGDFNDRFLEELTGDVTINTCFSQCTTDGSCADVGGPVDVTFQVDMTDVTDAFMIPEVNGAFNGWCGNCNAMTDVGGGVWQTTISLDPGVYEYKFSADAWTIEESLAGIPGDCTLTTGEFTNRLVTIEAGGPVTLDPVCWNSCSGCGMGGTLSQITFQVDMTTVSDAFMIPEVNGTFNGWCGNCNAMTDMGGGVWSTTIALESGTYEYKYSADSWTIEEDLTGVEGDCLLTTEGFSNRLLEVGEEDMIIDVVCWMSCEACIDNVQELERVRLTVFPNPLEDGFLTVESGFVGTVNVYNTLGAQIRTIELSGIKESFDLSDLNSGVYFLKSELGLSLAEIIVMK